MNKEKICEMLNGREYRKEITDDIKEAIAGTDLVIVFGASDDLMEFRGAIYDEVGCFNGGKAYLDKNGLISNECDEHDCPYFARLLESAVIIEAIWDHDGYSWVYKTDIPHATFDIMEDDEQYCRGIVFNLSDVESKPS